MTMADTIAVMSSGVIEQLGAPGDLYEHPQTTFVANFLGQSNLLAGRISSADGSDLWVDVRGMTLRAARDRSPVSSGDVWVGIRPEKMTLQRATSESDHSANRLRGGVITDVSFVGVSTQYLVRMPWDQELMVFEQNTGERGGFMVGDQVDLVWRFDHTFVLDASQDAHAGAQLEDQ
jgi:spermidine/putrescine transport system ATP-binding protein